MSAVNKLLKKRHQIGQQQQNQEEGMNSQIPSIPGQIPSQASFNNFNQNIYEYDQKMESVYQKYESLSQNNIADVKFSCRHFPNSILTHNKVKTPLLCYTGAINPDIQQVMNRSADRLPRCNYCRSYMNCYNQILTNKNGSKHYRCFICGKENTFVDYDPHAEDSNQYLQLTDPCYRLFGADGVYNSLAPQNVFIFLIDISSSAFHSKMLYYTITVLKDVFSREEQDDTIVHIYTYDQAIQQYDFSGQEIKCSILDSTITQPNIKFAQPLKQIRQNLFQLLDCLEEISEKNTKQGSNFHGAFSYVYECIKHTAGKIFVFQSNQSFAGEKICQEIMKEKDGSESEGINPIRKSILDSANKTFFNKFVQNLLNTSITCEFFIFTKLYKNIRVLSDTCKLTNSGLKLYYKDSQQDLNRFYYELYYILGTANYIDLRYELTLSPGWYFTAVFGNLYKLKEFVIFKINHYDHSKKLCIGFLPREDQPMLPYMCFQMISNFYYQRQHYMEVNTVVIPVTSNAAKIYQGIDAQITAAGMARTYLSNLRLEELSTLRTKIFKNCATIWIAANTYFKKNPPDEIRTIMSTILGLMKSAHIQLDLINHTPILDRVIAQRNLLQFSGYLENFSFFNPYLFRLSSMTEDMCQGDIEFVYPEVVQLKFSEVKQGLYLMDCGLMLYLFVSKQCNAALLKELFGRDKFGKNELLNEQMLRDESGLGRQVTSLIRVLRQQKMYGWIPLYVVRCGQGSSNERLFYLNFTMEKYEEFKTCKLTLGEFISTLEHQYADRLHA